MKPILCAIVSILVWAAAAFAQPSAPAVTVRTASGVLAGKALDGGVKLFAGIPYAAPPVGPLRWQPPQPPAPWTGVRDATKFGPSCPQPATSITGPVGATSEDCLFLNVWTAAEANASLPVMVWIHGGGHTVGSGSVAFYDGANLARHGVVLVTINYRLGALGYLAHPALSKECPRGVSGNYGLLDQIAALQWVRANIAAFGGDPNCVTIFGESAGAMSVCRLMVSPLAKGLFHRAIAESGAAAGSRKMRGGAKSAEAAGEELAAALGCDKAADVLAAMRAKSADEIVAAQNASVGLFAKGIKWGPAVDGWAIPEDPVEMLRAGKHNAAPMILGTNADEGTMFLAAVPIRRVAGYHLTARTLFGAGAEEILKLFPADKDEDVPGALNKLTTVAAFVHPAKVVAAAMDGNEPSAWMYHFTRMPANDRAKKLGVFHGIEIPYVFGNLRGGGFDANDQRLSEAMMQYWTAFARTGKPAPAGLPQWPAYRKAADNYMEFGDRPAMREGLYKEACELMDRRTQSTTQPAFGD